jgi:helix-turn-helix protein
VTDRKEEKDANLSPEEWVEGVGGAWTEGPVTHPDPEFARLVTEDRDRREVEHTIVTSLGELRRLAGLNQIDVAERWGHGQSHVSKVERDPLRAELTTLAGYVQALGGRLTVTVEAGDHVYYEDVVIPESA